MRPEGFRLWGGVLLNAGGDWRNDGASVLGVVSLRAHVVHISGPTLVL